MNKSLNLEMNTSELTEIRFESETNDRMNRLSSLNHYIELDRAYKDLE